MSIKSIQPIRIGFALYDKSLLTAVTLAAEMFMSANMLRPRQHQRNHPIQIDIIAPKNTKVDTIGALTLATTIDYSQDHHFDYIFLPPMWGNPMSSVMKLPQISTWLKWQLARQATIVATGTGVCWLAHCGLLNGKVATTHWSFSERFAQLFPDVILRKEIPITRSETIYCAKSINTQTELVVFFIAKMFGKDVARTIERHYTQDVSKSTDEPYFEFGGEVQPDETVSIAQDYLSANMSKNVSITALARHCDVSASTIVRHFKAQVGETPHQYLTRIRLNQAKSLLLDRNLTIGEVAELVGFSDSHYFSEKFYRSFAVRPRQYREMAKTKLYRR